MKTAFIFPGQGAQVAGMGADVAGVHSEAAEIYKRADEIVGFKLSKLCFDGPQEELNKTAISQPAIFATSAAILEVIVSERPAGKVQSKFINWKFYLNLR